MFVTALAVVGLSTGCGNDDSPDGRSAGEPTMEAAKEVAQVIDGGFTVVEGPVFTSDGSLVVVKGPTVPGEPKVLKVDISTGEVSTLFTDRTNSSYSSAQISPIDDRIYLTDIVGGHIDSIRQDGSGFRTVAEGDIEGVRMAPDDIAFDQDGNLFVNDMLGYDRPGWDAMGRVIRFDHATFAPVVLARNLAAPNGIAFTPDFSALWVSEYTGNKISYLGLNAGHTAVVKSWPAVYVNSGSTQVDSLAVDSVGNIYQGVHGVPEMRIWSPRGALLKTVTLPSDAPDGVDSMTNVAIKPGTTDAYATVGGTNGGYVYTFTALAPGGPQSNG